MNITHGLNGHPNTGRQAEIILKGRKRKNTDLCFCQFAKLAH